jgi:hypothetical protein
VKYARAIGRKVALVLYDDKDSENQQGPVNSGIFSKCWERAGKPKDFFALDSSYTGASPNLLGPYWTNGPTMFLLSGKEIVLSKGWDPSQVDLAVEYTLPKRGLRLGHVQTAISSNPTDTRVM